MVPGALTVDRCVTTMFVQSRDMSMNSSLANRAYDSDSAHRRDIVLLLLSPLPDVSQRSFLLLVALPLYYVLRLPSFLLFFNTELQRRKPSCGGSKILTVAGMVRLLRN